MKVDFKFTKRGLEVTVKNTSREVPEDSQYLWDFGDYRENSQSTLSNPGPYTYPEEGFYLITLKITPPESSGLKPSIQKYSIGVSENMYPTLSDSIYNIIDSYIPDELLSTISGQDKRVYIEKWQLYLQPLVDHDIPIEEYNNEFAYKPLENQLIVEAAAYDWLMTGVMNLMRSTSTAIQDSSNGSQTESEEPSSNGNVKKIVTGPTEVEFFNNVLDGETASSLAKTIVTAMKPGGIIDNIKRNLCMLSSRLNIYLPICNNINTVVIPKVVNRRDPGLLGGPNPSYPINK